MSTVRFKKHTNTTAIELKQFRNLGELNSWSLVYVDLRDTPAFLSW